MSNDLLGIVRELNTAAGTFKYYSLAELEKQGKNISRLPFSIRILVENILRNYDDFSFTKQHVDTILGWTPTPPDVDIPFMPFRVLMQDFTGVPAVVDIASLRAEAARQGADPQRINPNVNVDLVIDHSVQIDYFGTTNSFVRNVDLEYERNHERYVFLKWAQKSIENFSVLPPGMGICHQVNLEYLAKAIVTRDGVACPDSLVGTDSHTPMVNGIGVVAWGVGGIEAEAVMLGQPIYMIMPEVIGLKLTGKLPEGATATDMVLTITELLRKYGVVGKFVELFGDGLDNLTVPDRATISNMSPEFGCTVTYVPIDDKTIEYMRKSARSEEQLDLVEKYCKSNMLWRENEDAIEYTHVLHLDLSTVIPSLAGPKRPQDRVPMKDLKSKFAEIMQKDYNRTYVPVEQRSESKNGVLHAKQMQSNGMDYMLADGSVVIAAITSCTNTSNPSVMLGAGIVAKKAVERGLQTKPWVKTSLAPGSKVVTEYLENSNLLRSLEALRFHVVGYGCTTCIGNSGALPTPIANAITESDLVVTSVLSGNRNFEARVHPQVAQNYLASPMLVVAYALAGRVDIDFAVEPIGTDPNGDPVFLRDIWPTQQEIADVMLSVLKADDFAETYKTAYDGDEAWQKLAAPESELFAWEENSTYIKHAPFFQNLPAEPSELVDISNARALLVLGDSITTDHISPAGNIAKNSPAARYLAERGVEPKDYNSYGSRRGNHEVMMRGTFANVRLTNKLASQKGGWTVHFPTGDETSVFDASMRYQEAGTPLVVLAGKEYGSGSSRDWAAKGTNLLGIKAVIAESYERIHRSNLVGMGVLPLQFNPGDSAESLGLTGREVFSISGIADALEPQKQLTVTATAEDGTVKTFSVLCRIDSKPEIEYYRHGGILHFVFRRMLSSN